MGSKQVSTIGLGTWQFGERGWGWGQDFGNREVERIIDRALELGINFLIPRLCTAMAGRKGF